MHLLRMVHEEVRGQEEIEEAVVKKEWLVIM